MSDTDPTSLAVLVSGGGRSLESLVGVIGRGELQAQIGLVLSDRPGIRALERAAPLDLPHRVVARKEMSGPEEFSEQVWKAIEEHGCSLTVLAGFLRLLLLPEHWIGRVINIHPALLPAHGGKGCYGDRVHRAVLAAGDPETGCTVHFVDNTYDTGPHILQRRVAVQAGDTADTLAARVFEEEKLALPEAIRRVIRGEARFEKASG